MNKTLHGELTAPRHAPPRSLVFVAALTLLVSCATTGGAGSAGTAATVFVGTILTMDDRGTIAGAVSVDGLGRILKVGAEKDVMDGLGTGVDVI